MCTIKCALQRGAFFLLNNHGTIFLSTFIFIDNVKETKCTNFLKHSLWGSVRWFVGLMKFQFLELCEQV